VAALAQRGFTLIEILVVLVVVGIMVGLASVRLMPDDERLLADEAERLALLLEQTRDQAVASGEPIAFSVDGSGYRFSALDNDSAWVARAGDELLRERTLGSGARVDALRANGTQLAAGERLLFLPSGSNAPFVAELALNSAHARVIGDRLGRVRVELPQGVP
jgi:type II secretion system protein H